MGLAAPRSGVRRSGGRGGPACVEPQRMGMGQTLFNSTTPSRQRGTAKRSGRGSGAPASAPATGSAPRSERSTPRASASVTAVALVELGGLQHHAVGCGGPALLCGGVVDVAAGLGMGERQ